MKTLLREEMTLTAAPITYFFIAFAVMTMFPGYPIVLSGFFVCLGILYTFQFAREYNDILYTVLLPVSRDDVVRAKFAFTVCVETMAFLITIILATIRMTVLNNVEPYASNPLMGANLAFLGYVLVVYALFNTVFLSSFFRTAYKYGRPFIMFCAASFVIAIVSEVLPHLPGLGALGTTTADPTQAVVLAVGILSFVLGTAFSLRASVRNFSQIDL